MEKEKKKKKRKTPKSVHVGELVMRPKNYYNLKGRTRKLRHLYRVNRNWFEKNGVSYESFSQEVLDYQRRGENANLENAVRQWTHQEIFVSKEKRGLRNIFKSMGPETKMALVKAAGGKTIVDKMGRPHYFNAKGRPFRFKADYLERPKLERDEDEMGWYWDEIKGEYVMVDDGGITDIGLQFMDNQDEGDEGGTPMNTGIALVTKGWQPKKTA